MGDDVPVIVQVNHAFDQAGLRHIARENKNPEGALVGRLPDPGLPGGPVQEGGFNQAARTGGDTLELGGVVNLDLVVVPGLGGHGGVTGEVLLTHQEGDLGGVLGQENGLFGGGESSANNQDLTPGEELPVTGSAIGHSPAGVLLLTFEPDLTGAGSGGNQNAEGPQIAPGCVDHLDVAIHINPGGLGRHELRTEVLGLLTHGLGQLVPIRPGHSWVVDHVRSDGDLPAEIVLLQNQSTVPGTGQVEPGAQSGRATTDDDHIIEILVFLHVPYFLVDEVHTVRGTPQSQRRPGNRRNRLSGKADTLRHAAPLR